MFAYLYYDGQFGVMILRILYL